MTETAARPSLTPANPLRAAEVREAAIVLFAERGYRGTTMNDIADRVGIRGPSLYKHVNSKQGILSDVIVSTMDMLLEHQVAALESNDTPAAQLHAIVHAAVADHVNDRARAFVCDRELGSLEGEARQTVSNQRDRYWRTLRKVIDAGVADGSFEVTSIPVMTFSVIELACSPAAWYSDSSRVLPGEVCDQLADIALRMVGYKGK